MTKRAIIIDDERLARNELRRMLLQHPEIEIIDEAANAEEAIEKIDQHHPDLIFLDVQMPGKTGFDMLQELDDAPCVIFTTAYDEYALKAFETHAIDYLLKPFSKERFDKAVEKYLEGAMHQKTSMQALLATAADLPSQSNRIVVKNGGKIKIIPVPDIQYLEAADDYVKIITAEGSFLKNKTMSFFETTLPQNSFVRTHRSYILNVSEITRIDPYEKEAHLAILRSGSRIPVSKGGYAKLKTILGL